MKRLFFVLILSLFSVSLAMAESVNTYTTPATGIKKELVRTVDTANTANAVVRRDASGNFAAGTITGTVTGNVTGTLTGLAIQGGAAVAATSGAVAIPATTLYSSYITNATAEIAATLADGVAGQMKIIKLKTKDTNNMVLTPAHFNDGTTITFDASAEVAILVFVGTGWSVVYTNATVGA